MPNPPVTPEETDPVRAKRAQVAKWTLLANRVGYLFVALAMALFVIAFAVGFSATMANLVIITFVIGCILLAPSIIVGYAVKAAERDDLRTWLLRSSLLNSGIGRSPLPFGN